MCKQDHKAIDPGGILITGIFLLVRGNVPIILLHQGNPLLERLELHGSLLLQCMANGCRWYVVDELLFIGLLPVALPLQALREEQAGEYQPT
jgi:hypothetical protein